MNKSDSLMWDEEVRVVVKMQEADNGNESYFAPFKLMKGIDVLLLPKRRKRCIANLVLSSES